MTVLQPEDFGPPFCESAVTSRVKLKLKRDTGADRSFKGRGRESERKTCQSFAFLCEQCAPELNIAPAHLRALTLPGGETVMVTLARPTLQICIALLRVPHLWWWLHIFGSAVSVSFRT